MRLILGFAVAGFGLSACAAAKTTASVATLPVKGAYHTTKFAGKGAWTTGKYTGKAVYYSGKGLYKVGKFPIDVSAEVLETTADVVRLTADVVDTAEGVVTLTTVVARAEIETELAKLQAARKVLHVWIDAV